MDDRDREMLIRVEQQLSNSTQNQQTILEDLREIFQRLEHDSKVVTVISGDIKGHLDSSIIRWSGLEKRLLEMERRLETIENRLEDNSQNVIIEREGRTEALTREREERSRDNEERKNFEQRVRATVNTIAWIIGTLASAATAISVVTLLRQ
jgi:predicted RND superfamily exporter protein